MASSVPSQRQSLEVLSTEPVSNRVKWRSAIQRGPASRLSACVVPPLEANDSSYLIDDEITLENDTLE